MVTPSSSTVPSADGTPIAVERRGAGRPLVLIGGAFNDRSTMTALATELAAGFTTVQYDRRGRGDSGPILGNPPASERLAMELADLAAVIDSVGGSASVFGHSSGGVLALEAAARGGSIDRVAVYEPSYVVEGTRPRPAADLVDTVAALVADGDRDGAVGLFLTEAVGIPEQYVAGMRTDPGTWGGMTALAHTLPSDLALHEPGHPIPEHLRRISCPTLVLDGGASADWARATGRAVAATIEGAEHQTLAGQDHAILRAPAPLVEPLTRFFG
jgi:pimeloyl-ACP methyl ester carboxylesterase